MNSNKFTSPVGWFNLRLPKNWEEYELEGEDKLSLREVGGDLTYTQYQDSFCRAFVVTSAI